MPALFQKTKTPQPALPGCMPNQGSNTDEMKFVERTEMAIMQYVMLVKAQQQGGITRENLQQTFRGGLQMSGDHFEHCIRTLVSENHLREEGNKYSLTDDGREDVQKLQHLFLEIPNVVGQGGPKQGTPQKAIAGQNAGSNMPRTSGADTGMKGGATPPPTDGQNPSPPREKNR